MKTRVQLQVFPCLLALSAPSFAQGQVPIPAQQVPPSVRSGNMSTTPVGMVLGGAGASQLLIKSPGQGGAAPAVWSTSRFGASSELHPEYTMSAIFGPLAPLIELTGFSTGNDRMPVVNTDGSLNMLNPIWFGLTVSVTNDSRGSANGHVERVRAGGTNSPGAELFTYYAADSVGIDVSLINTTVSERSRESLGLGANTAALPAEREDISALDHGLGVIPFDPNQRSGMMFAVRNRVYFALSANCVDGLPSDFAEIPYTSNPVQTVAADSASIYTSSWEEVSPGVYGWGTPEVYRSASALSLDPEADQIDAVAVDFTSNQVIFSTQVESNRDQILVHSLGQTGPLLPLLDSNGVALSSQLGLTEDSDVNGTCGIDPEQINNWSGSIGIPELAYSVLGTEPMGVSVSRTETGNDGEGEIHVHVTGTDADGGQGTIYLYVTDRQRALLGGPLTTPAGWSLISGLDLAPGTLDVSWVYPAPTVAMDLAVTAVLVIESEDRTTQPLVRGSWVSMLRL